MLSQLSHPKLDFLRAGLDNVAARALGLTSCVSGSRELRETGACSGVLEPKYLLDQFILAWERDDRHWVGASLGPKAEVLFGVLLKGKTWPAIRVEYWKAKSGGDVAVGYHFVTTGWWSAAPEPFEIKVHERSPANPEIETQFATRTGADCCRYRIRFIETREFYVKYLVDHSDLGGLLRVIAGCAVEQERQH